MFPATLKEMHLYELIMSCKKEIMLNFMWGITIAHCAKTGYFFPKSHLDEKVICMVHLWTKISDSYFRGKSKVLAERLVVIAGKLDGTSKFPAEDISQEGLFQPQRD